MVSLATQSDRTLFFDFLPIDLGTHLGVHRPASSSTPCRARVYYNATRKLVLQGADGVVFVADSQARRFDENLESLQNLQENLLEQGVDVRTDAGRAPVQQAGACRATSSCRRQSSMTRSTSAAVESFAADALHGSGVFETLKGISELVLRKLAVGSAPA